MVQYLPVGMLSIEPESCADPEGLIYLLQQFQFGRVGADRLLARGLGLEFKLYRSRGLEAWRSCCDVFHYGSEKYAAWNWAKGMDWSVPIACAARHLYALHISGYSGAELDSESGLPHLGHAMCNFVMLHWYEIHYPDGDDRPTLPESVNAK
jgi:hypothetical protein